MTKATDNVLDFERRQVPFQEGDTIASALFRAGVRTFSRSFKYRRRRGLYCLTGDCPNCLVTVDGAPYVRACETAAQAGQRVSRETGFPSADHDVLAIADRLHFLLPVGFYYKTMLRPRWLWPRVEPAIRRVAGRGRTPPAVPPASREQRHLHPDVVVIGAGVAGLAAALAAAEAGERVVLCEEGVIGGRVPAGPTRERIERLASAVRSNPAIAILEQAPAVGVYEGPLVVVNAPDFLQMVHPGRVIVATGAVERHPVFQGCDLPGVWLGRGAARLAGVHGLAPGRTAVVVGSTGETPEHAEFLRRAGADVRLLERAEPVAARGRRRLERVTLRIDGAEETLDCDALVLSLGLVPRDGLLRQGAGLPVVGAGDVVEPGCSLDEAEESGRRAAAGATDEPAPSALPPCPKAGVVCVCEDVTAHDLRTAWEEGFRSTELLKRYTTATMGPCQGILCHEHLRAFVAEQAGMDAVVAGPTTARPPSRPITLEQAAAGEQAELHHRTALHERHLELGAIMEPAGAWRRPESYGDPTAEYWAVRKDVSIMDVGTLGKYLLGGPDALEFLEHLYPCHVHDLQPGRIRYALLLGENGFVVDDGLICPLGGGRYYLTFTSAGADHAESHLRDWVDTLGHRALLVNRTSELGAINVAGPKARELLQKLSSDPFGNADFPYLHHREVTVAGVPCRAIRLGFVGELSYELHHGGSRSVELWNALLEAGAELGVQPHGLESLRLLRLEKGHVLIGQDTDYDSTPEKLGMGWAVKMEKPAFVGRAALERIAQLPIHRRLVAIQFAGGVPPEGAPLHAGGRQVGHLTSCRFSPALGHAVALGFTTRVDGAFPDTLEAAGTTGTVVGHAFYDPEGVRLRA